MKAKSYETQIEYFDGSLLDDGLPKKCSICVPFKVTGDDRVRRTVERKEGKRVILVGYKVKRIEVDFDLEDLPETVSKTETVVYDSIKEEN